MKQHCLLIILALLFNFQGKFDCQTNNQNDMMTTFGTWYPTNNSQNNYNMNNNYGNNNQNCYIQVLFLSYLFFRSIF